MIKFYSDMNDNIARLRPLLARSMTIFLTKELINFNSKD
jgi:hypothetical protein